MSVFVPVRFVTVGLVFVSALLARSAFAVRDHVVVVQAPRQTEASISHVPGDRVAVLSVKNAPHQTLGILQRQTGPAMTAAERIEQMNGLLKVALHLKNETVRVRIRRLGRRSGTFSITFSIKPRPQKWDAASSIIGIVPGTPGFPEWPPAPPPVPRQNPCRQFKQVLRVLELLHADRPPSKSALLELARHIPNPECKDYFLARVAAHRLHTDLSVDMLQRWAYEFSAKDRWPAFPYPYSYSALVAAAVLLRTKYYPEADVLLATDRVQVSRRLIPYRGLLMSDLLAARDDSASALRLLRAIGDQAATPALRIAAATRLVDLSARNGPAAGQRAVDKLTSNQPAATFGLGFVLRAAEIAWAHRDWASAQRLFEPLENSADRRARNHALLRLGDLVLRTLGDQRVGRALAFYQRIDRRDRCFFALGRLRRVLLDTSDREALERRVMDALTNPVCRGQAVEAHYAMARLSMIRNQYHFAMTLVDRAERLHADQWSSRATFKALSEQITTDAVGRLRRNRDWEKLADFYQEHLVDRSHTLSSAASEAVANALNRLGLHHQAANLLRSALNRTNAREELDDLTLSLAKSYLAGGKTYLAEIVLDYFRRVRSRSEKVWLVEQARAELFVRQGNGKAAITALDAAEISTPEGDAQQRARFLRAQAQYLLGHADDAASTLVSLLQHPWHPPLEAQGIGVKVLSICVRQCKAVNLERLLKAYQSTGHDALISERIRYQSAKRGVGPKPELEAESVWSRFEDAKRGDRAGRKIGPLSQGEKR